MNEPTSSSADSGRLPLIIGLGNEHRSDDRSGLVVARALRPQLSGRARVEECISGGIALLDLWRDSERVLVIDAVRSGAPAGTVHRLEPVDGDVAHLRSPASTHGLSLAEAVALAKGLGQLPRHLVIYGIEAANVRVGDDLSPEVARAVVETTGRILAELSVADAEETPEPSGGAAHA